MLTAKKGAVSLDERSKVFSCDELLKELVLPFSKRVLLSHSKVLLLFFFFPVEQYIARGVILGA